jgi:hypothetical protein
LPAAVRFGRIFCSSRISHEASEDTASTASVQVELIVSQPMRPDEAQARRTQRIHKHACSSACMQRGPNCFFPFFCGPLKLTVQDRKNLKQPQRHQESAESHAISTDIYAVTWSMSGVHRKPNASFFPIFQMTVRKRPLAFLRPPSEGNAPHTSMQRASVCMRCVRA